MKKEKYIGEEAIKRPGGAQKDAVIESHSNSADNGWRYSDGGMR